MRRTTRSHWCLPRRPVLDSNWLAFDPATGWCAGAQCVPSLNANARPPGTEIDLLVIHAISLPAGCYGGPHIEALFTNQLDLSAHPGFPGLAELEVSAHFLVRRDGTCLQFVSTLERAWHAGVSRFATRTGCNDFSIGIELEGCDGDAFAEAQYETLVALTATLRAAYPAIAVGNIVGHADIAPGRKTDPGPFFDWPRYRRALGGGSSG